MTTGIPHDQNLEKEMEKQMGCMTGFFHIFDRHQILTGKRLYATKRLPPITATDSTPEIVNSAGSPSVSRGLEKPRQTRAMGSPNPDRLKASPVTDLRSPATELVAPATIQAKSPLPFPIFDLKEGTKSSWKFCKEAPRLSLDSRTITDSKGTLDGREINRTIADADDKRRSPSVVARLMGLEQLPDSSPEPKKNAELRRSASESRVSKELFPYRFIDGNNFQLKQPNQSHCVVATTSTTLNVRPTDPTKKWTGNSKSVSPWKSAQQRKNCFDTDDFFPEPKQAVRIYGETERRLKMRGIDEPSKDLESLKQILEVLQLKGLLHSEKKSHQISQRNFVYESPIVVMKPYRSSASPVNRRFRTDSPPSGFRTRAARVRRECSPAASPRREWPEFGRRNSRSPTRRESNAKIMNSPARRSPWNSESMEQQKPTPAHSPRISSKRNISNQTITTPSTSNRKSTAKTDANETITEDESSSISESSAERSKIEDHGGGRSLLERCDKLLHSIAEMTATELQPSPVSVLHSSFYKDESSSSSPVMKRSIDLIDHLGEFEEQIWSPAISPVQSNFENESDDCDFVYISEIIQATNNLPEDSNIFLLLEKQQYLKGNNDTSEVSRLRRKLIFDTVTEILHRKRQSPPWKVLSRSNYATSKPSLIQIWSEFKRIRERETAEDLFQIVCGVLRKDLAAGDAINGWGGCHVETPEMVLDIERLIFKDLVGEAIGDLAVLGGNSVVSAPRRRLVF